MHTRFLFRDACARNGSRNQTRRHKFTAISRAAEPTTHSRGPRIAWVVEADGWLPACPGSIPGSAGVSHRGIFPNGELCFLFKSTTSHTWSHKKNATRPSPTESSGDFEKNAVFISECSCRTICTYTVVCVCRRDICKCACTYMNTTIAARDPTNTHLPRRLAAPRAPTAPRASDTGLGAAGVPVRNKPPPPLVPSSASSQQSRPRAPLAAALSRPAIPSLAFQSCRGH